MMNRGKLLMKMVVLRGYFANPIVVRSFLQIEPFFRSNVIYLLTPPMHMIPYRVCPGVRVCCDRVWPLLDSVLFMGFMRSIAFRSLHFFIMIPVCILLIWCLVLLCGIFLSRNMCILMYSVDLYFRSTISLLVEIWIRIVP